jgi:hypothetical protein
MHNQSTTFHALFNLPKNDKSGTPQYHIKNLNLQNK